MSNRSRWNHMFFCVPAPHGNGIIHFHVPLVPLLFLAAAAPPYAAAQTSTKYSSSEYSYSNFDPSMAIVILVLVSAFFFVGFFSIYIRQCINYTAESGNYHYSVAARLLRSAPGLDPEVIESFPMFHYSEVKDLKVGKGALECAVCINEFEDDETLRLLPKCDHVFHPECIDAWLASHTTCPVCRANLMPTPDEVTGDTALGNADSTDDHNVRTELSEIQHVNQISINVDEDQNRDPAASNFPKQNRRRVAKFPRSHSTGHSLIRLGENCERYRLRLPEEARKQIISQRLKRTTSCVVVFPMEGSSRSGYRSGGEGGSRGRQVGRFDRVGRSDRWVFTMTPPFFSRTRSAMPPKVVVDGDVTAVETSKRYMTAVKTPLDRLAVNGDGVEKMSTRPPV